MYIPRAACYYDVQINNGPVIRYSHQSLVLVAIENHLDGFDTVRVNLVERRIDGAEFIVDRIVKNAYRRRSV